MLSPGLAALIYGLAQVPKHGGVRHAQVLIPAIRWAVLIAGSMARWLRTAHPLIDLKMFRTRTFSISSGAMVLFAIAFFGAMLLFPLYYQTVRGATALFFFFMHAAPPKIAILPLPAALLI